MRVFVLVLMALVSRPLLARTSIAASLVATLPVCHHEGQPDTWCEPGDRDSMAERAGVESRLAEAIARVGNNGRIVVASFSFSNQAVYDALCDKGRAGVSLEGFFDSTYSKETDPPRRLEAECQGSSGENVHVHLLGEKNEDEDDFVWRLHHNKFVLVDPGGGAPVSLVTSSGNLSDFGTSLHFESWAFMTAPTDSALASDYRCEVRALESASDQGEVDDPQAYRETLDGCLVESHRTWTRLEREGVVPLFSPDPRGTVFATLRDALDSVPEGAAIDVAVQHFLFRDLAAALERAVERGVRVRLVTDTGVFLEDSALPGELDFFESHLDADVSGMDVRFVRTNESIHQLMHNKFIVMSSSRRSRSSLVFAGAGNFTFSGFRKNYENYFLGSLPELVAGYQRTFDALWSRAVPREEL